MHRRALAIGVTAALAATGFANPAPAAKKPCTEGKCAVRKARALLKNRVLIRFTETGSAGTPSSLDQRLHLCAGGRFVYDVVSDIPGVSTTHNRTIGAWRVLSAHFSRDGRRVRARVRGTPDDGSPPLTVRITSDGTTVHVDGAPVIFQRSDVC
jgi:hypothetical protein